MSPGTPRVAFPVTDEWLDAPDGEKIYDPERGGWFERSGMTWQPCEPPVGHLCVDIAPGIPRVTPRRSPRDRYTKGKP